MQFKKIKIGFETKMILMVIMAVTIVCAIVLFYSTYSVYDSYEKELKGRLYQAINSTTKAIDMKMSSFEYTSNTLAEIAKEDLKSFKVIDSLLIRSLNDEQAIRAVSIIYKKDFFPNREGCHDRLAYIDPYTGKKMLRNKDESVSTMETDSNWVASYIRGEKYWCHPFHEKIHNRIPMICYSLPIYTVEGEKCAIWCSSIMLQWLDEIVKKIKTRSDFDVSIIASNGSYIVKSDENVSNLNKGQLITEVRTLDRLGWTLVFSADKKIIYDTVNDIIWKSIWYSLILILTMAIAIILTIRYSARPFVIEQRKTAEGKAAMQRELDIAAKTQQGLVPHAFPQRKDLELYGCLCPAKDVGGDMYDFFIHDNYLYFCIGDVSGKGVPASLFMAATHYLFRNVATNVENIAEATSHINQSLCLDNEQCTFVTYIYGKLNLSTGEIEYCNAGHNAPILIRHNNVKESTFIKSQYDSMPLGCWEDTEYKIETIQLKPGDALFLYTDGITEAMNKDNKIYGEDRTLQFITDNANGSPKQIIDDLLNNIHQFAIGIEQSDDITMLCFRWNGK